MMKRSILLVVLAWSSVAHADGWEHVRTDDGIVVHRRKHEGFDLHEFRGQGIVQAPIQRILGVLQDAPRRVEWMERCVASWTVERRGDTAAIEYNRTKGTW